MTRGRGSLSSQPAEPSTGNQFSSRLRHHMMSEKGHRTKPLTR